MQAVIDQRPMAIEFAPSLGRFTRFKWVVAGVLAVVLILLWVTGAGRHAEDPFPRSTGAASDVASTAASTAGSSVAARPGSSTGSGARSVADSSAGAGARTGAAATVLIAPSLLIERAVDGRLTLSGTAPDETTRDQWLNSVRIAAEGRSVTESLRVSPLVGAAPWSDRLREATTLLRERRLDSLSLDGNRLTLRGPRVAGAWQQETERLFREGMPAVSAVVSAAQGDATERSVSQVAAMRQSPVDRSLAQADAPGTAADNAAAAASINAAANTAIAGSASSTAVIAGAAATKASAPVSAASGSSGATSLAGGRTAGSTRSAGAACPSKIAPLAASIYFQSDSISLTRAERQRLEQLGQCLGKRKVVVTGHTDARHSKSHNLDLSRRRADAVAAAIVAGGADPAAVSIRAAGETRPAVTGTDSKARQRNRRVEIGLR